ncbi:hypothetical protein NKH37_32850 [Mesorhizobium sp. M1217]|uniref:hypothetical protein n=1 Tax=Mesorhizobium sp. M1217 TaxID=2957070 RepID=UPI00333BD05A
MAAPLTVCEAHSHTFSLPAGATHLASSSAFKNQAFRYGRNAYAVQSHPEVTIEEFRRWQDESSTRYGRPGTQTREEQQILMYRHDAAQAAWFYGFMKRLFGREGDIWHGDVFPFTPRPSSRAPKGDPESGNGAIEAATY